MIGNFGVRAAVTVKDTVAKKLEEERKRKEGRITDSCSKEGKKQIDKNASGKGVEDRSEHYLSNEDLDETSFV